MDLFNKKRVQELLNELQRMGEALADERHKVANLEQQVADYKAKELAAKRDDTIPWVQINSDGYDEVKGVKVAMDWNDAFIDYIEKLNIKGPTDEAAVQRWLALVNLHLIEQLESDAIENDPRGTVRDVVEGY